MTPKQAAFVDEYLVDFNATRAAIRAGYSERSAYNIGWGNLQRPAIALAIEARLAAMGGAPATAAGDASEVGPGEGGEDSAPGAGADAGELPRKVEPRAPAVAQLSQGWVLGQLVEIVERCMREVPVRDRSGRETGEWTFKPREALSALTLIGKHLGMFSSRLDVRFLREQAEAVAAAYDLDADEVVTEAQRWLQGRK